MVRLYRASLCYVLAVLWLLTPMSVPAQQAQSLAILDLEGRGISAIEAASLTDRLRTALVRTRAVTVVERGQMERVLSEQDFQLTGCTSDECAVEVGQLLGVTAMVAGSIGKVGATYSVDIRTIDVQSGQITHSLWRDYRGEIDGLLGIMPDIASELVSAIGARVAPEPEAPAPAVLTIHSDPAGALILLNGLEAGTTPLDSLEIEADRWHTLSLGLDDYHTLDTTIFVETEQFYDVILPLLPLPSRLTIVSDPPGARIHLDGEDRGSTPLSEIEVEGNQAHRVAMSLDGYHPADTTLYTAAGQAHELSVALKRLPSRLTILSDPPGAMVFLDNRRLSATPLSLPDVIPDTQHRVALRLAGYQQVDTTFFAQAGEQHQMSITLQPTVVAETTVMPPEAPPPETEQPQPSAQPKKADGGGTWVVLALLAAAGYYGYTQGWFGEKPPDDGLRVGNPPRVP